MWDSLLVVNNPIFFAMTIGSYTSISSTQRVVITFSKNQIARLYA